MLNFDNVNFKYKGDDFYTIRNLSFSVLDGEFISIIGASGCGKSTIFRLINSLEKPESGSITIDSIPIHKIKNYSSYMPQKDLLYPWRTIKKNICLPMEMQNKTKKEMEEQSEKMLKEVGLLEYKNKYPRDLSGGMRQRVSFVRAILTGANLLLLDEPFSALDSITKIALREWLLSEWQKYKKTVLFITHDVEEAIFLSQKVFVVTTQPLTHFEEYEIPLNYPRDRNCLNTSNILQLKEELIVKLRQEN